jgi:hypothetical protein
LIVEYIMTLRLNTGLVTDHPNWYQWGIRNLITSVQKIRESGATVASHPMSPLLLLTTKGSDAISTIYYTLLQLEIMSSSASQWPTLQPYWLGELWTIKQDTLQQVSTCQVTEPPQSVQHVALYYTQLSHWTFTISLELSEQVTMSTITIGQVHAVIKRTAS